MSITALCEAWQCSRATGSTLLVMLALADGSSPDGFSYPSVDTIAAKARIKKRQALRALDHLVEIGEVEVWRYRSKGRGPQRNAYQLVLGQYTCHRGTMPAEMIGSHDRAATGRKKIPAATRKRILERDGERCLACGGVEPLSVDHIVPVVKGGGDDDDNLQTLCRSCNSVKGTRTINFRVGVSGDTYIGDSGDTLQVTPVTPTQVPSETPVAGASDQVKQEPSEEPSLNHARRARDVLFDALAVACDYRLDAMTKEAARLCGIAAAEIRRVGGTAEMIPAAARRYRQEYTGAAMTPKAIANHWPRLVPREARKSICPVCETGGGHHGADCPRRKAA